MSQKATKTEPTPLFDGSNWDFKTIDRIYEACSEIGHNELGFDTYPTRIELINSEQMLDAYASVGMPIMYRHWSFGKQFAQQQQAYRKGLQGLALEIVINANPSLCYIMEENSATAQATVIAHAAIGHNHFFKNNVHFQRWTDADAILDYLEYAQKLVADCEERYGYDAVERTIDAAHALQAHGVHRSGHGERPKMTDELTRVRERERANRESEHELWRKVAPQKTLTDEESLREQAERSALGLPEENLLYFIEKNAPYMEEWQREIVRVVRTLANYFEPQRQTKMMNEGCATWTHYRIMNDLRERGLITQGAMLEFLHLHAHVIAQPKFPQAGFQASLNPYTMGFELARDIERMCTEPTDEDKEWFPDIAGNNAPVETLKWAWAEFRDESAIRQFLSPRLMREMRLFKVSANSDEPVARIDAIHDDQGYRNLRRALADSCDPITQQPQIEVSDVRLKGDRKLELVHRVHDGVQLDPKEAQRTLKHAARLWGYPVRITEIDAQTNAVYQSYEAE